MQVRKRAAWLMAGLALLPGCQKPFIMTEKDYSYFNDMSGTYQPGRYEAEPQIPDLKPRTVRDHSTRESWKLTLEEAKRVALLNNKQIAFLGYQPAEQGTRIDSELSAFDASFEFGGGWGRSDRQVSNTVQVFGTGQTAIQSNTFGGQNGFGSSATQGGATQDGFGGGPGGNLIGISKRNTFGGSTSISYQLDYQRVSPVSIFNAVNPSWTGELRLAIEQPLLQGFGTEFNRSRLLIARAQHEQTIQNFSVSVQTLLRDVEQAYWQLYFTYQDHYSRETGMKQALATWQKETNRFIVGNAAVPDVAQAREQFEIFRGEKLQAIIRIENAERNLRRLMGLAPEDGKQLVCADEPSIAEFEPNWHTGCLELLQNRPELAAQRYAIRAAEIELMRQKNGLLPDLTASMAYSVTGLDNQFDQQINQLVSNNFSDWVLGIRYRRPLGERAANAAVQRAKLTLSRERANLANLEHNAFHELAEAYQTIVGNYDSIQIQKDRRQASFQRLEAAWQFYILGKSTIDLVLEAQAGFSDALRFEGLAIAQYNQAIAQWEFVKGTILANDNVVLAEEQLSCVSDKFRKQRARMNAASLPLPLHKGCRDPEDKCVYTPDPLVPLYGPIPGLSSGTIEPSMDEQEKAERLGAPKPVDLYKADDLNEKPNVPPTLKPPQSSSEKPSGGEAKKGTSAVFPPARLPTTGSESVNVIFEDKPNSSSGLPAIPTLPDSNGDIGAIPQPPPIAPVK